jgi:hypothetical protein
MRLAWPLSTVAQSLGPEMHLDLVRSKVICGRPYRVRSLSNLPETLVRHVGLFLSRKASEVLKASGRTNSFSSSLAILAGSPLDQHGISGVCYW